HVRRLDGHVQRHRLRPRAVPGRRDPPRRALHVRPGAPLDSEVSEARRNHARSRPRHRVRRPLSNPGRPAVRRDRLRPARRADALLRGFQRGDTNTGAVDSLDAIADICADENVWHHVDGAYGAFFYLCEETKPVLKGLPRADSLTLDPHKGMFLPYGTGALL